METIDTTNYYDHPVIIPSGIPPKPEPNEEQCQ